MNKYYQTLKNILDKGKTQSNKKGNIKYLINEVLSMNKDDLLKIFNDHRIAKSKLRDELELYFNGITNHIALAFHALPEALTLCCWDLV